MEEEEDDDSDLDGDDVLQLDYDFEDDINEEMDYFIDMPWGIRKWLKTNESDVQYNYIILEAYNYECIKQTFCTIQCQCMYYSWLTINPQL